MRWQGKDEEPYNDTHYDGDVMRMDVLHSKSPHGVMASFLLGRFEGVMIVGMSKTAVARLRDAQPKTGDEPNSDDECHGVRPPRYPCRLSGGRFFPQEHSSTGGKRSLREISDPYGVQAARAKRQKVDAPNQPEEPLHPNRVYFQFAVRLKGTTAGLRGGQLPYL